jgi:hypothetical protein
MRLGCYLLDAGAAEPAGAADPDDALSGELAAGVLPPPQAARAPAATMTARRATSAMFFMMFSPVSEG